MCFKYIKRIQFILYKMNNINYTIVDTHKGNMFDLSSMYDINCNDNVIDFTIMYDYEELYKLYMTYSVKSLIQILNYYNLYKKKLLKDEIIQVLIIFELDINNRDLVIKRRRLWQNITELIENNYFKNFIMFTV